MAVEERLLFPGCMIANRLPFLEASARKVFEKLDIKTEDAPFGCCPDPVGHQSTDRNSWMAIGALNLSIAEERGKNIMSLCNGCTQTLTCVGHELKHDPEKMAAVNEILKKVGKEYKGNVSVHHFVMVLHDEIGVDKIKSAVTKPLSNLKIACHPGCHFMRPSDIMQTDDPWEPKILRELVAATGATPIDYDEEILCCGCGAAPADQEVAYAVLKRKLDSVKKAGADAIVVNCPSCFNTFDTHQRTLSKKVGEEYNIPVLYITELLALAMGFSYDELNLKMHRVRPTALAEKI